MAWFSEKKTTNYSDPDFGYLKPESLYFDSACQTLRPQAVLNAQEEYFKEYNACGGRVKYKWGEKVDAKVAETRTKILKLLDLSEKDYAVAFTLNTTYGINLVLNQLPWQEYDSVVTSEIEHNSVFLPTITVAKRFSKKRLVLPRTEDGALQYKSEDLAKAVVLVNVTSNIDGRNLINIKELITAVHNQGGLVLIDAAQAMAHNLAGLKRQDFDALFSSAHKMYGPSLGFVVIKKLLLEKLEMIFIGGGTVTNVIKDDFELIKTADDPAARLEPGLQNFAGIIGLGAAVDWLQGQKEDAGLNQALFTGLSKHPSVHLLNTVPSPIVSLYSDKVDAHRLALYLSEQNVMVRSGYFCCHYFLSDLKKYPPLLRFSLGLNNTLEQVQKTVELFNKIITNI